MPAAALRMPMIVSTSSVWPLPSTPAMPSTSPERTTMSSVVEQRAAVRGAQREALDAQDSLSVTVDVRVSGLGSSLPTIISASWREVTVFGSTVPTVVPRRITVTVSAIARHLVELVGDEEERVAVVAHRAQGVEQLVDLLRHEHRGRLVEDDDPRAAVEHLEDLHPLPVGDAEPLDQRVRVDVQAGGAGELADPGFGLRGRCRTSARRRARRSPARSGCRRA